MHKVSQAKRAITRRTSAAPVICIVPVLFFIGIGLADALAHNALAQASVYRCVAPDGSVEFRQRACQAAHGSTQIEIEDNHTGWVPPAAEEPAKSDTKKRTKKRQAASPADDKDRYADRCWSKQQQIERINTELRAGYSPQRGVKLRRRRTEYEAFLSRYCR
ncbi:MAG: hypothetical protein WBM40_02490 [Thiohalocapsa sp.]